MQSIISTILSILLLLTSLPLALSVAVVTVPELFDGHILGEMRFAGTFNGLDGVTVDKTGTMNEILVQVQTDHPNWKPNFTVPHRHGPPSDDASISARDNAVEAGEQRKVSERSVHLWMVLLTVLTGSYVLLAPCRPP